MKFSGWMKVFDETQDKETGIQNNRMGLGKLTLWSGRLLCYIFYKTWVFRIFQSIKDNSNSEMDSYKKLYIVIDFDFKTA